MSERGSCRDWVRGPLGPLRRRNVLPEWSTPVEQARRRQAADRQRGSPEPIQSHPVTGARRVASSLRRPNRHAPDHRAGQRQRVTLYGWRIIIISPFRSPRTRRRRASCKLLGHVGCPGPGGEYERHPRRPEARIPDEGGEDGDGPHRARELDPHLRHGGAHLRHAGQLTWPR